MKRSVFLGIDTSNYTTSAAIAALSDSGEPEILANEKVPLPVAPGERGLRQNDAVFAHTKQLPELFAKIRDILSENRLAAVAYSAFPRDAKGSYMPCFLAGRNAAAAAAAGAGAQLYQFSHQAGHVRAAVYSSGMPVKAGQRFIAFHVSGGTTEVLAVTPDPNGYAIYRFGGTTDLSAGQAIDRIGVRLGMRFPCGPEMEAAAREYQGVLPGATRVSVSGMDCHFSGLENLAGRLIDAGAEAPAVSAFTLDYVRRTLAELTTSALTVIPGAQVLYAGGVMSCGILKEKLAAPGRWFSAPAFSADNAAGIALLGLERYAAENGTVTEHA